MGETISELKESIEIEIKKLEESIQEFRDRMAKRIEAAESNMIHAAVLSIGKRLDDIEKRLPKLDEENELE